VREQGREGEEGDEGWIREEGLGIAAIVAVSWVY